MIEGHGRVLWPCAKDRSMSLSSLKSTVRGRFGRILAGPLLLLMAAWTVPAQAAAIHSEVDLLAAGDGLITFVDATNLQWLDLTATNGLSYNQAAASSFATSHGFRHATQSEVLALWSAFRIAPGGLTSNVDPIKELTPLIGATTADQSPSAGILQTFITHAWYDTGIAGSTNRALTLVQQINSNPEQGNAVISAGAVSRDQVFSNVGNYLVRLVTPIPEPATLTLFGLGVLGLGAVRRRIRSGAAAT